MCADLSYVDPGQGWCSHQIVVGDSFGRGLSRRHLLSHLPSVHHVALLGVLARPAGGNPRRLVGLFRVDGRPRSVLEARGPIPLVEDK